MERMRFEVLSMLYEASDRCVDFPIDIGGFIRRLGVWEDQLYTTLEFLHERGYIRYESAPWRVNVCLTVKGVDYMERDRGKRQTIRE
jgi:hypothetical protein